MTEFEIIEQYFRRGNKPFRKITAGIGDDAALLEVPDGNSIAVSTDTLVSDVHFFHDADSYDIGFKSLAVNLSDLAAMGAEPAWATLSLTLPEANDMWLAGFARGFFELADKYHLDLVGGNISKGALSVTVQIMGIVPADQAIFRSGAVVGDDIYVSGYLGMGAFALAVLKGEYEDLKQAPDSCLERLYRPEPRVDLGLALRGIATSGIDLSDGLAGDLGHLLEANAIGAQVLLDRLPVHQTMQGLDMDILYKTCLERGDDYELCFTAGKSMHARIDEIADRINVPLTVIGHIVPGNNISWIAKDGSKQDRISLAYRHF